MALCFPCSSPLSQAFPAAAPPQISGRRWSFYCHHSFAPLECCAVGITQCVVFSWLLSLSSTLECMQASSCLFVSFDSLLFFKPYFLLANYFIRAVVGLQQVREDGTEIPIYPHFHTCVQFSSVAQSCPTLCDPMNRSTPGLPVHHHLPEFTQTHVHRVRDAIQPSHPRSSLSPTAPNPSQHQSFPMSQLFA